MTDLTYREDFDVDLVQSMGDDEMICKAARVSTLGAASLESTESEGLIRFLMRGRHGSPFEHGSMTFRISAPIFVWREFMRHRVGMSYNEQSGRYMELSPVFYAPHRSRPLVQEGKPGAYIFVAGDTYQYRAVIRNLSLAYESAWTSYQEMLQAGIAKEVARMCLPLAIYSTAYVTLNPRSMMHFLSLRVKSDVSTFPSYPQAEIEMVAIAMERIFAKRFPATHTAFNNSGRVCP